MLRAMRQKGIRSNLTLHMYHSTTSNEIMTLFHCTPLRCSRALALRYVSTLLGVGMSNFVLAIPAAEV